MSNIVVLGIGNRLLMDDGIGIHIVESLKKSNLNKSIHFVIGETDIDYCLDEIERAEFLIIVDAAKLGKAPGEIAVFKLNEMLNYNNIGLSMHNLHLFDIMLHSNPGINGIMVGIEPYVIDFGLEFSPELNSKLCEISKAIDDIINIQSQE